METKINNRNKRLVIVKSRNDKKIIVREPLILVLIMVSTVIWLPLLLFDINSYADNSPYNDSKNPPDKLNNAQLGDVRLRVGIVGIAADWDPAISTAYSNFIRDVYGLNALEKVAQGNVNYTSGTTAKLRWEEWEPILCTDWDVEYWPSENNTLGFNNSGGIKAINFTLREGVKFHDGSDWNATVMKWNIDRLYMISGNLTGNGDIARLGDFWIDASLWKPYFTPSWNLSSYLGHNSSYNGINTSITELVGYYPVIKQLTIIESKLSGGRVRVEWNDWNRYGMNGMYEYMISMYTYKDFYDKAIYGWDNEDPLYPDHLIGTGSYKYMNHNDISASGYMEKFVDYWNKTALETMGWYNIDYIDIITFPPSQLGTDACNTALLTNSVDFVYDYSTSSVDYNAIISNPQIKYHERGPSEYITQITLNSINETWWAWPAHESWRTNTLPGEYPSDKERAGGIPRALREVMNYAFNYDLYINTTMDGRAVRAGGVLGINNVFYNSSIPLPDYNLTKAREILLFTENDTSGEVYNTMGSTNGYNPNPDLYNFSKMCANRGLTSSSTDPEWQSVADSDPIFTLDFYWDDAHDDLKTVLQSSLRNIGVTLKDPDGTTNKVPTSIWEYCVKTYWLSTFDGNHSIWSANAWAMDYNMPTKIPEAWVAANYKDPNLGRWRIDGNPGIKDYFPQWNFGFCYNNDTDNWINRMTMSNDTENLKWLSKIAEKLQTELYPMIYVSQHKIGWVYWSEWETSSYWGYHSFALTKYVSLPDDSLPIITIHSPVQNEQFKTDPPPFNISINESNLDSTWYFLSNGTHQSNNYIFSGLTGLINQNAWDAFSNGSIEITFFANDTSGNVGSQMVTVIKITENFVLNPFIIDDTGEGDYTWDDAVEQGWCTGSGTEEDPYIIESLEIDGQDSSSCLSIINSSVYFILQNSIFSNAGGGINEAGLKLEHVSNAILSNIDCSDNNANGILLYDCQNITISHSSMNNNAFAGIYLNKSSYNFILDNTETINHNIWGIYLLFSNNNTVSGNFIGFNEYGLYFNNSNYNSILDNIFKQNDKAIHVDEDSEGNNIEGNTIITKREFPLIFVIISVAVGIVGIAGLSSAIVLRRRVSIPKHGKEIKVYGKKRTKIEGSLQERLSFIDHLIKKQNLKEAIKNLNEIKDLSKAYGLIDISETCEKSLIYCNELYLDAINKIKKTVLDVGTKYARLQIIDLSEKSGISNEEMIISVIQNMIQGNEIFGEYFSSSRAIAFDQQKNVDQIDKSLQAYIKVKHDEEKEYNVFLSYSTRDSDFFNIPRIVKSLENYTDINRVLYWEADSKQNIVEFMDETLQKCNVFILFCSEHSVKSAAVKDEWQAAFQRRKKELLKLIPVYIKEEHIPPILGHLLNVKFDKEDFDSFIEKLHQEIQR